MLLTEYGFCFRRPIVLPKLCRWCGERMQLVRGRVVACPDCDQNGWWQRDKHRA